MKKSTQLTQELIKDIKIFEDYTKLNPQDIFIRALYADLLRVNGDIQQAHDYFKSLHQLTSQSLYTAPHIFVPLRVIEKILEKNNELPTNAKTHINIVNREKNIDIFTQNDLVNSKDLFLCSTPSLKLQYQRLNQFNIEILNKFLQVNPYLIQIDISNNDIDQEYLSPLFAGLKACPSLGSLIMNQFSITEEKSNNEEITLADLVSDFLKTNSNLVQLSLKNNNLTNLAIRKLCAAIEENNSLTSLNIEENSIGLESIGYLNSLLITNSNSLTELYLPKIPTSDDPDQSYIRGLIENDKLKKLTIGSTILPNNNTDIIMALANTKLTYIKLYFQQLEDAQKDLFNKILLGNGTLTYINLEQDSDEEDSQSLEDSLSLGDSSMIFEVASNPICKRNYDIQTKQCSALKYSLYMQEIMNYRQTILNIPRCYTENVPSLLFLSSVAVEKESLDTLSNISQRIQNDDNLEKCISEFTEIAMNNITPYY